MPELNKYNYVSALEELPPPPTIDIRPTVTTATVERGLGLVLTIANLLITAIIITAMMLDGTQAMLAIVVGSLYFAVTMACFSLVVTGALSAIVAALAHEVTERKRIDAYAELGALSIEWRLAVEETRQIELLGRRPHADPLPQANQLQSYVAPFADGERAQVEGVRFAMGLYDTQGRPDPERIHRDGRLKLRMIGSKRGSGSREAGRWLLKAGIIQRVRGGYALDLTKYPTRDTLRHLL